ncbi:uncharacterized protein LOC110114020 [Dendrobium catenatum]|uniref:DUF7815 domain-containing protein n=1 Tax=Dendrobium catenatum TaxID=906689 RepID=A0A2I0VA54_9ASPA|nr:uncharacterized protein LOC110114020 [Dendrobium catenatum]PKU60289.1 hypothetical protein MA16_Dca025128 [Dendrobium catenatum]
MAPDYPSDLIQDIKIRLRQAAGVPSYDPGDPALGSFPCVADAVAALDPTLPDYLRCKRCHGGLLRGINSTICIFCGAEQRGEDFSRTISFNYTVGYQKFLKSLDLDGSEVVNLEAESKESSRGKDSPKVGVTLSNILDLKLRWPREREEIDNSNSNAAPSQVALVSLSGVNLDNFFSDQKNEVSSRSSTSQVSGHGANSFSVELDSSFSVTRNETVSGAQNATVEQFMPRKQDVITHANLSSRSQKFSFSERQKSLDVANSSADAEGSNSDDAFADWETDFQSASSATFEATSKQIDPVQYALDFQSANPTLVTAETESRTMDLFHNPIGYQSANYVTVGTESKKIDPFQNSSNFQPENPTVLAMESRTNDLLQNSVDFQSANSVAVAADSRHVDLFPSPAGFQSRNLETVEKELRYIDHFQNSGADFSPIIIPKSDQNTNMGHNSSNDDTGGVLTHEVDEAISHNDWLQNEMWSQSPKISKETGRLDGISSSIFVGELKNEEKETTSVKVSWTQDDLWQRSVNEINNKSFNHHDDDLFDDWQDFRTATNASGNLSVLQSLTSDKVHVLPLEANSGDLEDLEFGCFIQSDSFSSALNGLQSPNHVNTRQQGGDSIANRENQSNEKIGTATALSSGSDINANTPNASDLDASQYKVDMLLAQMPDLSFMLEESLYIPKKPSSSELNT